jgi:hypothetical protein
LNAELEKEDTNCSKYNVGFDPVGIRVNILILTSANVVLDVVETCASLAKSLQLLYFASLEFMFSNNAVANANAFLASTLSDR